MGEIRSTYDIIMEKAKDITVTDEEKEEFKRNELRSKIRGLVQKRLDGVVGEEEMSKEISAFGDADVKTAEEILKEECLERIELEEDNERVLGILEALSGMDTASIRQALGDFQEKLSQKRQELEEKLMERIKQRGIRGSAVRANVRAAPEWGSVVQETKEAFNSALQKIKATSSSTSTT